MRLCALVSILLTACGPGLIDGVERHEEPSPETATPSVAPQAEPDGSQCAADEVWVTALQRCLPDCRIRSSCPETRPVCDQDTGLCAPEVSDCTVLGCPDESECNEATGYCEQSDCTTLGCADGECNEVTGECEQPDCTTLGCADGECNEATGECESMSACTPSCAGGEVCNPTTGACQLPPDCSVVGCPRAEQVCHASLNRCVFPCTTAADCPTDAPVTLVCSPQQVCVSQ
jgi:hypothetical protein